MTDDHGYHNIHSNPSYLRLATGHISSASKSWEAVVERSPLLYRVAYQNPYYDERARCLPQYLILNFYDLPFSPLH